MKKIVLSVVIVLLLLAVFLINNNKNYQIIDGVKYAITIDGVNSNTFPVGNYTANVTCNNAVGYYDKQLSKIIIKDITDNISCDADFTAVTQNDYLNNYITNLNNTESNDGVIVSENGIRYEGKNPNNYIWFNNELWRIIGVFDDTSHGIANNNLVKIIRNEAFGTLVWDRNMNNNWETSSLYNLLNNAYYNASIDTTNCLGGSQDIERSCDYRTKGIQSRYRSMIENVTWYLGGGGKSGFTTYTADSIYGYERNSATLLSNYPLSVTNKIGLMYESDYLYASKSSDCSRTTTQYQYGTNSCAGKNWLYGVGNEWLITPNYYDTTFVTFILNDGFISAYSSPNGNDYRPVVYLSSDVYRVSGTGTMLDPYIIAK